ncbi:MAG: ABC transporter ATP-binding protein [Nakamurella sp.]
MKPDPMDFSAVGTDATGVAGRLSTAAPHVSAATPISGRAARTPMKPGTKPIISLRDVEVHYPLGGSSVGRLLGRSRGVVKALDGVNLDVLPGEIVGLVGESGSGKSTLGRAMLGMAPVTSGTVTYRDTVISGLSDEHFRPYRKKMQMIFQDPAAALNPTMTIGDAINDALRIHDIPEAERPGRITESLERVGLAPASRFIPKYPSELSGGQKQRAIIARSICLGPEMLIADEPISMLDMSVRAKMLDLMEGLREDLNIAFLYITHDLASARFFCDRIAIMYLGRIVEIGPAQEVFERRQHPYTQALMRAIPDIKHRKDTAIELPRGEIPDASRPPMGCPFHPRCPLAFASCGWEGRDLKMLLEDRWTRVDLETYRKESSLVKGIESVETTVTDTGATSFIPSSDPVRLMEIVEEIKVETPKEPFFTALRAMHAERGGLRLDLVPFRRPFLTPQVGRVGEVSCHLYPSDGVGSHDGRAASAGLVDGN